MRKCVLALLLAASSAAPALASSGVPYFGGHFRGYPGHPIYRPIVRPLPVTAPLPPVVRPTPNPRNVIVIPDCRLGPC